MAGRDPERLPVGLGGHSLKIRRVRGEATDQDGGNPWARCGVSSSCLPHAWKLRERSRSRCHPAEGSPR